MRAAVPDGREPRHAVPHLDEGVGAAHPPGQLGDGGTGEHGVAAPPADDVVAVAPARSAGRPAAAEVRWTISSPAAAQRRITSSACSSDPPASGSSRSRHASTCTRRTPCADHVGDQLVDRSPPASARHPTVEYVLPSEYVIEGWPAPAYSTCSNYSDGADRYPPGSDGDVSANHADRRVLRPARRPRPPRPAGRAPGRRRRLRRPAHRRAAVADAPRGRCRRRVRRRRRPPRRDGARRRRARRPPAPGPRRVRPARPLARLRLRLGHVAGHVGDPAA